NSGVIHTVADLYTIELHQLTELDRFGTKSAENLLAAIEKSKSNELNRLVYALGIRGIGQRTATLLCEKFGSMDFLMAAEKDELAAIDNIGEVLAENVYTALREPHMIKLIERLRELGVNMTYSDGKVSDKFNGLTFVITGTLPTLKREEAKELIEKRGGKCSGSVSKKTSYVLAGEEAGSKLTKANELGIPVISEEQLLKMLDE
ncbi:MAG: BRCT domain-containing protein, partial [Oscillospiraceae bacterium]